VKKAEESKNKNQKVDGYFKVPLLITQGQRNRIDK
jgi:hypothetical protein